MKIWILGLLIALLSLSCNNDDEEDNNAIYQNESPVRVKRIVGENNVWGKYELEFHYRPDGWLKQVWRFGNLPYTTTRDTLGYFSVEYDVDYYKFDIVDYVLTIKKDSVDKLQSQYPEAIADTLKNRLRKKTLFSSSLSEGFYTVKRCRPPQDVWGDHRKHKWWKMIKRVNHWLFVTIMMCLDWEVIMENMNVLLANMSFHIWEMK